MKKRILSLLLAALMVFSLFSVTAFATGTPYAITNGTAQDAHGSISFDKATAAEGDTVTVTVNPNEGYQLKSLTATPVAPTISTIADVLATVEGFPASEVQTTPPSSAWVADVQNSRKCYAYTSVSGSNTALLLRIPSVTYTFFLTTTEVTPGENCYTASNNICTLKFNMTDGVLTGFTCTHKEGKSEDFDGTYAPASTPSPSLKPITPAKQTDGTYQFEMPAANVTVTAEFEEKAITIADIIATYENFPLTKDEDLYWTNNQGTTCYYFNNNLFFRYTSTKSLMQSMTVSVAADGKNYTYSDGTVTYTFIMDDSGVLAAITVSDSTDIKYNGTYGAPPTKYTVTNGTTDMNGDIAIDKASAAEGETVTITVTPDEGYQLKKLTVLSAISIAPPITPAQDASDNTKYTFKMPSYPVRVTAEFEEKAITIADILPDDFPTFSWPLPDNVWKNSVGSKMYVNNNGLTFGGVSLYNILSKPVTKDGNNYKYISNPYTITFVMDSNKLVKVITEGAENADNNGEYIPTHTHNPVKVNGQAATESAAGWKDYYECACGALFEDENGTTPIENLDAWKAQGSNGYIEPLPTHSSSGGSTPTVTVPVSGNENSVKVSASVSGSTATVKTMTDAELNKVTGGEAVEIDLTGLKKDIDTAKIPTETVEKIADKDGMSVKLSTATVTFDKAATQEIASQADGSTIQLVVDDIKTVSLNAVQKEAVGKLDTALIIDAYLVSNGVRLCTEGKGGFGGGKASVALPYELKNNRTAANYSVYYVDDAGKLEKLAAKYDAELGAFVFDITHFSNYVVAYDENAMPFADVPAGKYYYDAVKWALENGITEGKKTTLFDPSGSVTRAQVVTFLWRAAGKPVVNYAMNMSDVASGKYYTEAVRWAVAEGITKGTSDTTFSPDKVCTRAQIVTFLARFAGVEDEATGYTHGFTDAKATDYYNNAVAWAKDNKVTEGTTATTFSPNTDCTRAQVVTFLYRWMVK